MSIIFSQLPIPISSFISLTLVTYYDGGNESDSKDERRVVFSSTH